MEQPLLTVSYTLNTIDNAARQFWEALHTYRLFAFSGEMGAGKTTFIHHLCELLEVEDTVSSPTFALINEYHFRDKTNKDETIYHLDWYRLKNTAEAIDAGMEDCILQAAAGEAYCFTEWPEKAIELLQKPYLWVSIATINETELEMTIKAVR